MKDEITLKFGIILLSLALLSSCFTFIGINYISDQDAISEVNELDMNPIYNEDVRIGKFRLQEEIGFQSKTLEQLNDYLINNYIPKIDIYQYESWKLPSIFISEGGDCEDVVLYSLSVLDHNEYKLQPIIGDYNGEGHAWLIVDDYWLVDSIYKVVPYSKVDGYQAKFYYTDMLDGSLFFGFINRVATWDDGGGANNLASNASNWDLNIAPVAGDTIVINTGSSAVTWDIAATFAGFYMNASYTGTVTQSVDFGVSDFKAASGTFAGVTTKFLTVSGDFNLTGSSILTSQKLKLITTGTNKWVYCSHSNFGSLVYYQNTGSYKWRLSGYVGIAYSGSITFINSGNITLYDVDTKIYFTNANAGDVYSNTGLICGSGFFQYRVNLDKTLSFGNISSEFHLYMVGTSASRTITLSHDFGDIVRSLNFRLTGGASTYSITLNLNGYDLKVVNLIIERYCFLRNNAASYSWLHTNNGFLNTTLTSNLITSNIYCSWSDWNPRLTNSAPSIATNGTNWTWTPNYNETLSSTPTFSGPAWLNFVGGVISGTPTLDGLYQCWLNGTSQNGTLTLYYTWSINVTSYSGEVYNDGARFIGSIDYDAIILINYSVSYTLNVTGNITALILPFWLTLSNNGTDTSPWVLSGQPLYVGIYSVSLMSNSSLGKSYLNYTVEVLPAQESSYTYLIIWIVILSIFTLIGYIDKRVQILTGAVWILAGIFCFYEYSVIFVIISTGIGIYYLIAGITEVY